MTRRPRSGAPLDGFEPDEESACKEALLAAFSPSDMSEEGHARIIDAALTNPFRAASPEELRDAEALRLALDGFGGHPDAALAAALVSAWAPADSPSATRSILVPARHLGHSQPLRSRAGRVTFGFCALLAVAAATALVLRRGNTPEIPVASATLYAARSTVSLFNGDFKRGEASQRVDRIATARARELRSNRYDQWGVP